MPPNPELIDIDELRLELRGASAPSKALIQYQNLSGLALPVPLPPLPRQNTSHKSKAVSGHLYTACMSPISEEEDLPTPTASSHGLPPWAPLLVEGAIEYQNDVYAGIVAESIVKCTSWTDAIMPELVHHFIFMAVGTNAPHLAVFADRLQVQFIAHLGREDGYMFSRHLRRTIMQAFREFWDSKQPMAIKQANARSQELILYGHRLAVFTGQLLSQKILSSVEAMECVKLLCNEMIALEHVEALHALIFNAGPALWTLHPNDNPRARGESRTDYSNVIHDLRQDLLAHAGRTRARAFSFTGRSVRNEYVLMIERIRRLLAAYMQRLS
ncbi:hypothetical protein HGRIS_005620 [Hohenbuehelia grisea]|uniref:Uncharacterized protein n=1 Tax=Hohenbuehelia grisea TaxID=104357 RepID=A0ABR3JXK3_9AGAR